MRGGVATHITTATAARPAAAARNRRPVPPRALSAIRRLKAEKSVIVRWIPRRSKSTKPVSRLPTTAPAVLTA
jgi:hypothetical protein